MVHKGNQVFQDILVNRDLVDILGIMGKMVNLAIAAILAIAAQVFLGILVILEVALADILEFLVGEIDPGFRMVFVNDGGHFFNR